MTGPRHGQRHGHGLGTLVRLALRRNRWFFLVWILLMVSVVPATATAYNTIVGDPPNPLLLDVMATNPTMRAMLGPPIDLFTVGGFTVWRVGTFMATIAAIPMMLGVIRITRADEEEGRSELIRAGAVGRHTPLTAAVLVGCAAAALFGLLICLAMVGVGAPPTGSVAFGAGMAFSAAVFVGVGALTAQITSSARAARGMGMAVLGAAYLLRAVADAPGEDSPVAVLAWFSPVEWMALARPYADERWWVLALPLLLAVTLVLLAFRLESVRDFGAGLRPAKLGRAQALASLRSPGALAWRLQRGSVIGWTVGLVIVGLTFGSLSGTLPDMLEDAPQLEQMFRAMGQGAEDLLDGFYVAMLGIISVVTTILGIQLLHRLAADERRGHAELVLSTATRRTRLALAYLVIAVLVPTVLLTVVGGLMAVPEVSRGAASGRIVEVAGAALGLAPGCWLLIGIAMLLYGWLPRLSWLVWLLVGWSLFMVWVGSVLGLPDWLVQLTPWEPLPALPVEPMDWTPVLAMSAASAALMALGLLGFRRRDLVSP